MTALNPKKFGRVAVLYGGKSSEREVSLMSGGRILAVLQAAGVDAIGIDVDDNIVKRLVSESIDRVFIALHGTWGEDGKIQGLLDFLKIPYTGTGVAGSALAMDKIRSKYIFQALGIPTLPFVILDDHSNYQAVIDQLGLPLAIKPSADGSSMGVTKVKSLEEMAKAYQLAKHYVGQVIAEPYIETAEYTVGILNNEALPIIRVVAPKSEEFYDYHAKYFSDDTQYLIPCGLSAEKEREIQAISLAAFHAVGAKDWGRVDGVYDAQGQFWVLEVNTIPGLTDHSLVPKAARAIGIEFPELALRILAQTL